MNERINNLRLDAGISQLKDDPRLVVIDREGNVIDPLIGLEKFAELIVLECAACCGSQADMRNIRKRFGLPVESNVQYPGPEAQGHQSQYGREYNIPKEQNNGNQT